MAKSPQSPAEVMFGSNKPQKEGKSGKKAKDKPKSPIRFKPKIDGISVTIPIEDEQHRKYISAMLGHIANEKSSLSSYGYAPKGGYKHSLLFYPHHEVMTAPPFLVQAGPKSEGKAFLRFEWNPSRFSPSQLKDIQLQLSAVLDVSWQVKLISLGRVTRLDIAVDLRGIHIDEMIISNKWTRAMGLYTGAEGRTETIYFGKSTSSQVVVYDVVAKAKDLGLPPPKVATTRIERRSRKLCPVKDLGGIDNLLAHIEVSHPAPETCPLGPGPYEAFRNHCQMRGIKAALGAVPVYRRKVMANWIGAQVASWWSPDSLWGNWPTVLAKYGLSSLSINQDLQ